MKKLSIFGKSVLIFIDCMLYGCLGPEYRRSSVCESMCGCVGVWVCGCTLELRNHAADFNQSYRNGFSKGLDLCV